MSEQEMKACPCCGSPSQECTGDSVLKMPTCTSLVSQHRVKCPICGLRTEWFDSASAAVAAWNQRAGAVPGVTVKRGMLNDRLLDEYVKQAARYDGSWLVEELVEKVKPILAELAELRLQLATTMSLVAAQSETLKLAETELAPLRALREAAQAIKDSQDWYWTAKPGKDTQIEQMWTAFDDALAACDKASAVSTDEHNSAGDLPPKEESSKYRG